MKVRVFAVFATLCILLSGCGGPIDGAADLNVLHPLEVREQYAELPNEFVDENIKGYLGYLDIPLSDSELTEPDRIDNQDNFYVGEGIFLGRKVDVSIWYEGDTPTHVDLKWPEKYVVEDIAKMVSDSVGAELPEANEYEMELAIPGTDLMISIMNYELFDESSIYIKPTGDLTSSSGASSSESEALSTYTSAEGLPDGLFNQAAKEAIGMLGKPFESAGLDAASGVSTGSGTTIFYLEGLEFLGEPCEDGHGQPRLVYSDEAISSGQGLPIELFFSYANPLKSNGHEETMDIIEGISEALGLEETLEVDVDYDSSSKMATGVYRTVEFPNAKLSIEVRNTDGSVEITISLMG